MHHTINIMLSHQQPMMMKKMHGLVSAMHAVTTELYRDHFKEEKI